MALFSYILYRKQENEGENVMNLAEMVLTAVAEGGEVCAKDIARKLEIPASIVARVLNKLEADGLLKTL